MSTVCTAVTNGATAAQTPITKRETTCTANHCYSASNRKRCHKHNHKSRSSRRSLSASHHSRGQSAGSRSNSRSVNLEESSMILARTTSTNTTTKGAKMLLTIPATKSKLNQTLLALINSGTSASLIFHYAVYKHVKQKTRKKTTCSTQGGSFKIFRKTHLTKLQLPQFTTRRDIEEIYHMFVNKQSERHSFIIRHSLK